MLDLQPHKDNLESRLYNEFRDRKDQRKVRDREGKDDRLGMLQLFRPLAIHIAKNLHIRDILHYLNPLQY